MTVHITHNGTFRLKGVQDPMEGALSQHLTQQQRAHVPGVTVRNVCPQP